MKVLISCDYSSAGEYVLQEAQKFISNLSDVEIYIYTVIDISLVSVGSLYNNSELLTTLEQEAQGLKKKAEEIFSGKKIQFEHEVGFPAEMVLQKTITLPADLLILGTHGRTGLGRLIIGSVAENILRHCNCNVMVIPVKNKVSG